MYAGGSTIAGIELIMQWNARLNFIIIICLQTTPSTVELNVLLYLSIRLSYL